MVLAQQYSTTTTLVGGMHGKQPQASLCGAQPPAHLLVAHGKHLWRLLVEIFVEGGVLDAFML